MNCWTSCAVYPFRLIHAVAGRVHVSVNYNARNDELAYLPSQPEPAAALASDLNRAVANDDRSAAGARERHHTWQKAGI